MYMFLASVRIYNSIEERTEEEQMALAAKNYAEAMEVIEEYYGDELEKVTGLEMISDSRILFLTKEEMVNVRESGLNCF